MRIVISLCPPVGRPTDVEITGDPATPLSALIDELIRIDPRTAAPLFLGRDQLRADQPLRALHHGDQLGVARPISAAAPPGGTWRLQVVGGPDAGPDYALAIGELCVGRDHSAGMCLADPELSGRHVQLAITEAEVCVRDLTSTNGSTVDAAAVGSTPIRLSPGARLRIGASTLTVARSTEPSAVLVDDGVGGWLVNRRPRACPDPGRPRIMLPSPPQSRSPSRLPIVASLAPVAVGAAMAVWLHSPQYLLFMLLSPIMLVASTISERRGLRRGRRCDWARYAVERDRAQRALAAAVRSDECSRRAETPDPATILATAVTRSPRLWERRAGDSDALHVTVGTGSLPVRVDLRIASGEQQPPPVALQVPVPLSLSQAGVVGLAGPRSPVLGMARSLLGQLVTLHGPATLALTLLADETNADDWSWARWLPHLGDPQSTVGELRIGLRPDERARRTADLIRTLDERLTRPDDPSSLRQLLIVDELPDPRECPELARVLTQGPAVGLHTVCLRRTTGTLPAECGAVVRIGGEVGTRARLVTRSGHPLEGIVPDGVSRSTAASLSRALAPLREGGATATARIPATSRLLTLLDLPAPTAAAIRARRHADTGTRAVLGETASGPFSVDLVNDGPHALVAGTTGSGKSELLQSLVAALAVANRPADMTFVLVDYKGGAAFGHCARLPHTVGLVTDLDSHLTQRALTSLTAELRRRERLLAKAGVPDLDAYRAVATKQPEQEPIPRTVLIVDEFATLVEELPDFVTGLVGIAMRGRSLGIHLILATQRPSGVVSPTIRANTNLRIALRMVDDAESRDVIDSAVAATIDTTAPGRAFARLGAGAPVEFQTARVGGSTTSTASTESVTARPFRWSAPRQPPSQDVSSPVGSDLQLLVDAVAAADPGPAPQSPWLPPLPAVLSLDDLPPAPELVPFALADHPDEQRRSVLGLQLGQSGALAVVGAARSGRSTALRTIAAAATTRLSPTELHLYGLDCGSGGLLGLVELPHAGAICARHEVQRGDRVLSRLVEELERRRALLTRCGLGSVIEQHAVVSTAERLPWLMLLVDGWDGFDADYGSLDHGRPVDTLLRLARDGAAAGLQVVITGDRHLLSGRPAASLGQRLLLRLPNRADYLLADVTERFVPETMPPGRGVLGGSSVAVQVALPTADPSYRAQTARLAEIAATARIRWSLTHDTTSVLTHDATTPAGSRPQPGLPFQVRPLPDNLRAEQCQPTERPGSRWALIGVGGDEAATIGVDLAEDGPGFLIAGPSRSGRSSALHTMVMSLLRSGSRIALVLPRRSPMWTLQGRPGVVGVFGTDDARGLSEALSGGPVVVLADDIHTMTDAPIGEPILSALRCDGGTHAVVAAGDSEALGATFRGPAAAVRASRTGLLLQPVAADGELLGVHVPRMARSGPAGRGLLVLGGVITMVQAAMTDVGPAGGSASVVRPVRAQGTGDVVGQRADLRLLQGGHGDADTRWAG